MVRQCPACKASAQMSDMACPRCGQSFTVSSDPIHGRSAVGLTEVLGGLIGLAIPVVGISLLLSQCHGQSEKTPEQLEADAKQVELSREKGSHCLSGWDGSVPALKEAVKAQLRDPGSFEHIETVIAPQGSDGRHEVMMKYRARNGFGGMTVEYAKASASNFDCSVRLERIGQ